MVDLATLWRRLLTGRCCACGQPYLPIYNAKTIFTDPLCLPCRDARGPELYADGTRAPS